MDLEPELGDVGSKKPPSRPRGIWVRCMLLWPALAFSGCHLLLTGSPVPLWWTDRLERPVKVIGCTEEALILADGRSVRLPFLRRLPVQDPVFRKVLQRGVEVRADGEVYGLLTTSRNCGNDPFWWYTQRINLSDLAGVLDLSLIDTTIVDPEAIRWLNETGYKGVDGQGVPWFVHHSARRVREVLDAAATHHSPALEPSPAGH